MFAVLPDMFDPIFAQKNLDPAQSRVAVLTSKSDFSDFRDNLTPSRFQDIHIFSCNNGIVEMFFNGKETHFFPTQLDISDFFVPFTHFDAIVITTSVSNISVDIFKSCIGLLSPNGSIAYIKDQSSSKIKEYLSQHSRYKQKLNTDYSIKSAGDWEILSFPRKYMLNLFETDLSNNALYTNHPTDFLVDSSVPSTLHEPDNLFYLNDQSFAHRFRSNYLVPQLKLRSYTDAIVHRNQLVYKDSHILPESFRFHNNPYARHKSVEFYDARLSVIKRTYGNYRYLPGTYFYLGSEYPGVYGHSLNEMLPRLWAWARVKELHPECKLIISCRDDGTAPPWLMEILNIFGVAKEDIFVQRFAYRVERLFGSTPMFSNGHNGFMHPELPRLSHQLYVNALQRVSSSNFPNKIFITRHGTDKRACRNIGEVEAVAINRGYTAIQPDLLTIPEQIVLFHNATDVIGVGGSGMINTIFSQHLKSLTVISPSSYTALNEYFIGRMISDKTTYFLETPELDENGKTGFHSNFTFDFSRNRDLLDLAL